MPAAVVDKLLAFVADALDVARATRSRSSTRSATAMPSSNEGRAELKEVLTLVSAFGVPDSHFALNLSIARGLDYYTGTVYETTLNDHPRDRLDLLGRPLRESCQPLHQVADCPASASRSARRGFTGSCAKRDFSAAVAAASMRSSRRWTKPSCRAISRWRARCASAGINTEVVIGAGKLARQFKYADRAGIRYRARARARRNRQGCRHGQGPAQPGSVRSAARRARAIAFCSARRRPPAAGCRIIRLRRNGSVRRHPHETNMTQPILLDGNSLTRDHVVAIAREGAKVTLDAAQLDPRAARGGLPRRKSEVRRADLRRHDRLRQQCGQAARRTSRARRAARRQSGNARRHAARRAAAQPDRHACGLRRRAVRAGCRARHARDPHQHADARPFRHSRSDAAGARRRC